jgi:hypothetical protein
MWCSVNETREDECSTALREYKQLVRKIKEEPTTRTQSYTNEAFEGDDESVGAESTVVDQGAALNGFNDEDETWENIELIDVRVGKQDITGLTPKENAQRRGGLEPTDTMDLESRLGDDGVLQRQADSSKTR